MAAKLFKVDDLGRAARRILRPMDLARWLAPTAACALSVIMFVGGTAHRALPEGAIGHGTYFASMALDNSAPANADRQFFALSEVDENLQWNVWPHSSSRSTNESSWPAALAVFSQTNRLLP